MAIKNPDEAAAAFEVLNDDQQADAAERAALDETRKDLEGRDEPNDDAPATADGGEVVPAAADASVDESVGYTMSVDRRIGSTHLGVEYHAPGEEDAREGRFRFGKPNGRSSTALFAPVEEAESSEDQSVNEMTEYVWGTLAEWCVEDSAPGVEKPPTGPDFWAERMGLGDAIQMLQNLALGIDPNEQ